MEREGILFLESVNILDLPIIILLYIKEIFSKQVIFKQIDSITGSLRSISRLFISPCRIKQYFPSISHSFSLRLFRKRNYKRDIKSVVAARREYYYRTHVHYNTQGHEHLFIFIVLFFQALNMNAYLDHIPENKKIQ